MDSQACFGQCLRQLIANYDLKLTELAERINVDHSLVRKWLAGTRVPSLKSDYYSILCRILNLSRSERLRLKYSQLLALDEQSLQIIKDKEDYRLIFESFLDPVLITKPDGQIVAANPAACAFFQRNEQEICKAGRDKLVDTKDKNFVRAIKERQNTGKASTIATYIKKDGTKQLTEMSTALYTDSSGELGAYVIIRAV